jgi:electron transport complex protein RnfG
MSGYREQITTATLLLGLFALLGTALVAFTFDQTRETIQANERAALLRSLHQLIPPQRHDNDIFHDRIQVRSADLLMSEEPVTVYRARKQGKPVALALTTFAPDGYNGKIKILVGVNYNGSLSGIRIVSHHETPGLGDAIETDRSNWVYQFNNRSLTNPGSKKWAVKRDGGVFDQFTGATITPRAVVKAVYRSLLYYQANREMLFSKPTANKKP